MTYINPEIAGWIHPTEEEWKRELGTENWVLGRRTQRRVERYGANAVFLSDKRYAQLKAKIIASRPHCEHCGQLLPTKD